MKKTVFIIPGIVILCLSVLVLIGYFHPTFEKNTIEGKSEKDFTVSVGAGMASGPGHEEGALRRIDTPIRLKIIDIYNVMGVITLSDALFVMALFVASILGTYLMFCFVKAKMNRPKLLSAYELAIKNLTEIDTKKAQSDNELKELFYKISRILRNYFKEALSFGSGELTTKEFLAKVDGTAGLSDDTKKSAKELVVHCDLVKFSGNTTNMDEFKSHFDITKKIIDQINAATTPKENNK